jgi:hypothetical protein
MLKFLKKLVGFITGEKTMAGKRPRVREYTVTLSSRGGPCDIHFDLDPPGLDFANAGRPGFFVYFDAVDGPGVTNARFDSADPIWVQNVAACPTAACNWDQFKSVGLINEGKTLVVRNKNDPPAQQFGFTLRFRVDGCPNVVEFDPIGNNQNGPQ